MRKILLSLTFLFALSTVAALWLTQMNPANFSTLSPAAGGQETGHGQAMVGGDFTLTDQHGKTVSDADFRGKLMLVFFGFTHCPDICPVTTTSLSKTMELLGDKAGSVAPIFISVDPKRDTPDVLKNYFANFDARMVALTGTPQQIEKVADAYKAYYSRTEPPEGEEEGGHGEHGAADDTNYTVDHSGYIYLMSKDGKYIRHFPYDATPQELAQAVSENMQ
jgi:protein SCO1/2